MNNRTEPKLVVLVSLVRKRVGTVILLPRMCLELFLMRGVVFKKYSLSTHYLLASNQTLCMSCFFLLSPFLLPWQETWFLKISVLNRLFFCLNTCKQRARIPTPIPLEMAGFYRAACSLSSFTSTKEKE